MSKYPSSSPDPNGMSQRWKDVLNDAVKSGKIPGIPVSKLVNGVPTYPAAIELQRNESAVCSSYYGACRIEGNVYDAPDGVFGVGFAGAPSEVRFRIVNPDSAT